MKKLNQTWRQKRRRPGSGTVVERSDLKANDLPSPGLVGKFENRCSKDGSFDNEESLNSLGFSLEWDNEALAAMNEIEAKMVKNSNPILKECRHQGNSPACRNFNTFHGERISTPIEITNHTASKLIKNAVSPVFAASSSDECKVKELEHLKMNPNQVYVEENYNSAVEEGSPKENNKCSDLNELNVQDRQRSKAAMSTLSIDSWGLPECVSNKYKSVGITEIFTWQRECLLTGKAFIGGNLVYSAPTSAGKTLVSEMLMLKRVLATKRKAIYILPFVSVAREKMFHLQDMFKEAGIRVDGYMGALVPAGGFAGIDIAVCTIEKANSLVNRLMEEKKMDTLGVVVVDEMHMIGDGHRGYLLELMLTKIRFMQETLVSGDESVETNNVQIIGMSATLPNLGMLASWLNADLYLTDFRPVPLVETIKVGKVIMDAEMQKISEISSSDIVRGDEEHIVPLCLETIRDCHSVLIFCPTKQWCEKLAKTIADNLKKFLISESKENLGLDGDQVSSFNAKSRTGCIDTNAISEVFEQLRRTPVGLDKALADIVSSGVSFHHAGLTFDERDVIEGAFRRGAIRVLVATSTLSSGVNLPARRVILRTPMFHGKVIDSLAYKQMTGRAGRKGVDTKGESILICKQAEKQKGLKLLRADLQPVYSCLMGYKGDGEITGMKRALLEIIAARVASTRADVEMYARCTFLNTCLAEKQAMNTDTAIRNTIQFLVENEFIRLEQTAMKADLSNENADERFSPTQLGSATLASALSPDEALVVFKELQKARRCFVLENELHVVYQVMPIYMQSQWPELDWYHYFNLFEKLPPQYKRVGEIVGVEEAFLARAIRGRILTRTEEQRRKLAIHQRFYSALVLLDLVNEIPLKTVSRRYNVNKGLLQSLQNSASTFAGMVTKFCQKLGWKNLEMLVDQFQSRLSFGVTRELCDLVRISLLNGARARMLYNAGYHTASAVATISVADLTKLLESFAPFESRKNLQGETAREISSREKVRSFWVTGKDGMTEKQAASLIIAEAKALVKEDLVSLGVKLTDVQFISGNEVNRNDNVQEDEEIHSGEKIQKNYSRANLNLKRKVDTVRAEPIGPHDVESREKKARSLEKNLVKAAVTDQTVDMAEQIGKISDKEDNRLRNREKININLIVDSKKTFISGPSALTKKLLSSARIIKIREPERENAAPVTAADEHIPAKSIMTEKNSIQEKPSGNTRFICRGNAKSAQNCHVFRAGEKQTISDISERANRRSDMNEVKPIREINILENNSFEEKTCFENHSENTIVAKNCEQPLRRCDGKKKNCNEEGHFSSTDRTNTGMKEQIIVEENSNKNCQELFDVSFSVKNKATDQSKPCLDKEFLETSQEGVSLNCPADNSNCIENNESSVNNFDDSMKEEDGSLILISGNEDESIADEEYGDKIDTTLELFSETFCEDSQIDVEMIKVIYEKDSGCNQVHNKEVLFTTSGCQKDIQFENHCKIRHSTEKRAEKLSNDSLKENSSDDIFGSYDFSSPFEVTGRQKVESFCLKFSDSVCKDAAWSPELIEDPPQQNDVGSIAKVLDLNEALDFHEDSLDLHQEDKVFSQSKNDDIFIYPRYRNPLTCRNNPATVLEEDTETRNFTSVIDKLKAEMLCRNVVDEKQKGTREIQKTTSLEESDSEIRMSCSDSFARALCVELNDDPARVEESRGQKKRRSSERIATRNSTIVKNEKFSVVHVTADKAAFNKFMKEWRAKRVFSISAALCSHIDGNLRGFTDDKIHENHKYYQGRIAGISVCFGGKTAYFIDINQPENLVQEDLNIDNVIQEVIGEFSKETQSINKIVFDAKEHYKIIRKYFGTQLNGRVSDPKVAAWLLDPGSKELTLHELVQRHLGTDFKELVKKIGSTYNTGSIGLVSHSAASPRLRACIEAVMAYELMSVLELRLASDGLITCFRETEMPVMLILAKMEMNGIGFSVGQCETLKNILRGKMEQLESNCKRLAGRPFSVNAPEEVAHVLFIELGLPPSGDHDVLVAQKKGSKTSRSRVKHLSTAKGVLEKLKKMHPLPMQILEWRKVNNSLAKVLYPMQRAKEYCNATNMYRIFPNCQFHTVTGRVIIAEPGLQNVPKDFDISLTTNELQHFSKAAHKIDTIHRNIDEEWPEPNVQPYAYAISMRTAFVPSDGGILLAADYSQLELRIITHLSKDSRLMYILNGNGDVFRMIAAEINRCDADRVTDEQRQAAKAICYGIIYGIGPKALGEKLGISESDAGSFMEGFKNRFSGIKDFVRRTIESVRGKGYVTTMNGRRRYFTALNAKSMHARGQAERQAVNTIVQGSAADLVKMAMISIDKRIEREFLGESYVHQHDNPGSNVCDTELNSPRGTRGSRQNTNGNAPEQHNRVNMHNDQLKIEWHQPKLVLQLHDELMYECSLSNKEKLFEIVKTEMEQAMKLVVQLPVKVRTGRSWGNMYEFAS